MVTVGWDFTSKKNNGISMVDCLLARVAVFFLDSETPKVGCCFFVLTVRLENFKVLVFLYMIWLSILHMFHILFPFCIFAFNQK